MLVSYSIFLNAQLLALEVARFKPSSRSKKTVPIIVFVISPTPIRYFLNFFFTYYMPLNFLLYMKLSLSQCEKSKISQGLDTHSL